MRYKLILTPINQKKAIFSQITNFSYKNNLFTPGNTRVSFGNTLPPFSVTYRPVSAVFNTTQQHYKPLFLIDILPC